MGHDVHDDGYRETAITGSWTGPEPWCIQVSKKQIVTSSLTCKDLILWGASVTESVLGIRSPALKFRIGVWGAVSRHPSHHPHRGSPGSAQHICTHRWPKPIYMFHICHMPLQWCRKVWDNSCRIYTISEIEMESLSQAHSFRMHTRMELWIMEIFDRSILYLMYWIWSYYHASALSGNIIRTWIKPL